MQVQSYLFFEGRAEEAIEFYQRALEAEVKMIMRYKDNPEHTKANCPDGKAPPDDKIMHADLRIGETRVLISDGRCEGRPVFQGFGLAITVANEADADRRFAALAEGGRVVMPLGKTFYSPRFGMVTDRFGVFWMIMVPQA
jgi:PhnB protein